MKPASRGVAIVAVVAIITGLAACSDNAVKSPAVPSTAPTAQPSLSPSVVRPLRARRRPSPSVALASPSVASTPVPTANPAKVVTGRAYRPVIDPAGFTTEISNPYLPLVPGTVWTYKGGSERVVTAVTADTKWIMGVKTVVVRDRGFTNGTLARTRSTGSPRMPPGTCGTSARTPPSAQDGKIASRAARGRRGSMARNRAS